LPAGGFGAPGDGVGALCVGSGVGAVLGDSVAVGAGAGAVAVGVDVGAGLDWIPRTTIEQSAAMPFTCAVQLVGFAMAGELSVNPNVVLAPGAIAPFQDTFFAVSDPLRTDASALHAEMLPFHGTEAFQLAVGLAP
jgi:hypothetical protein